MRRTSKLHINGLLLLCLTLLLPAPHTAQAATPGQTADGLHYFKDVERVTIYRYDGADAAITIPETIDKVPVTDIEDWTFANNASLTSVTLPDKVTRIGNGAFSGCSSLTTVNIPAGVTSIGIRTFSGCGSLAGITLPNNMNSIGDEAFANCSSLTSITIPSSVTSIGTGAFLNTSVTIRGDVGSAAYIYAGDHGLPFVAVGNQTSEGLVYTTDGKKATIIGYTGSEYYMTIPDEIDGVPVTAIGDGAFANCSSIEIVKISDHITSIGKNAFNGCSNLEEIHIPPAVTRIGAGTLDNTSAKIVCKSKSKADEYAQANGIFCRKIGQTTDGFYYAIENGEGFITGYDGSATQINILVEVERVAVIEIEMNAFYSMPGLISVSIPHGVKYIGDAAFQFCSKLETITIPSSVIGIGMAALDDCPALTIRGYTSSYAENYAKDNGIPFVALDALPPLPGDANLDGKVNIQDLESLINYLVSKTPCPSMDNADANGDNTVDIKDVKWIIDKIIGG